MGKPSGLFRRNGIWHFRRRWPSDVVSLLKGEGFIRSLRSGEYKQALKLLPDVEAEYGLVVRRARAGGPSTAEAELAVYIAPPAGIYRRTVHATWPVDAALPELPAVHSEALAKRFFQDAMQSLNAEPPASEYTPKAISDYRDELEDRLALYRGHGLSDDRDHLIGTEIAVLRRSGFRVEPTSEARLLLRNFLQRALVQIETVRLARLIGDYSDVIGDSMFCHLPSVEADLTLRSSSQGAPPRISKGAGVTLADLIKGYDRKFIANENLTLKTGNKNRATLAIIQRYFGGEADVAQIDYDQLEGFGEVLANLPPNVTKKFGPDADLAGIARENKRLGGPTLNRETQSTYLQMASRLFEFAKGRRFIAHNDAVHLRPIGRVTPPASRRRPFTDIQLRAIFTAPIYAGCVDDERNFAKPGFKHPRRSRFWVPLIALFAGLRMEEIFQLTPAHIFLAADGMPFFFISPDMRIKTESGFREVPIHRELRQIGFMRFVADRARDGSNLPLFADVPPASDGFCSTNFSKRFATFLKSLGIKDDPRRTCFHSFRHNFRDGLRQPNANPDFVREVGGWTRGQDTSEIYGDGTRATLMRPLIDGITYDLDLSHLYEARR